MSHTCHARGCNVGVPPEKLMCLRHWRMVPRGIQTAVWRHYRVGQCDDMNPSAEWHEAADAAIAAVAERERPPAAPVPATVLGRPIEITEEETFSVVIPARPELTELVNPESALTENGGCQVARERAKGYCEGCGRMLGSLTEPPTALPGMVEPSRNRILLMPVRNKKGSRTDPEAWRILCQICDPERDKLGRPLAVKKAPPLRSRRRRRR